VLEGLDGHAASSAGLDGDVAFEGVDELRDEEGERRERALVLEDGELPAEVAEVLARCGTSDRVRAEGAVVEEEDVPEVLVLVGGEEGRTPALTPEPEPAPEGREARR
jgi:hypothetical protein